jgi:hypothetical protein
VAYGDFTYPKIKPSKTKPGNDADGWKRGAVGIDGAFDKDGKDFMKSADPKADSFMYGPSRPNGPWRTASHLRDPGTITNDDDKCYRGVDE